MSVKAKDQTGGDLCKSHAARCDKDFLRVCPSKLSRRELEDVYYSLLENNLELKRAVNSQNEKLRTLSTKVQRMSAQNRTSLTREPRECCAAAKVAISEQRSLIADLKKANECMAERIRRLNMRLCSAKQFLKRSPNQCPIKCFNCISGASTSVKNLSTSALNDKSDDVDNLRSVALSAHSVNKKASTTRSVETNTTEHYNVDMGKTDNICDENKCRTTMEEFKRKILDLQEELSKTHTEYSVRMSQLEAQVSVLRTARAQSRRGEDAQLLARRLRDASAATELETQLKLERGKVAELEMRLKASEMSRQVAKTIEQHLSNVSRLEEKRRASQNDSERCNICVSPLFTLNDAPPTEQPTMSNRLCQLAVPEDKHCRSEDSGYAENRDSDKGRIIDSVNRELMQRVAHLQAQLDAVKLTVDNPEQSPLDIRSKPDFDSYEVVIKEPDVPTLKNVKDYSCVIIDPAKKVIVEIEHVNDGSKDNETFPEQKWPNDDKTQVHDDQKPSSSKRRESILSKQQSRFESQSYQRQLEQTKSQTSKNEPEFDQVSKQSSIDSRLNPCSNNKHNIEVKLDSDQKIYNYDKEDVRMEEGDEILTSDHTLFKSDTQDSVSNTRDVTATDSLHQKVKVTCKCSKCEDNAENSDANGTKQLSEIGDDNEMFRKDVEQLEDQKVLGKMETELPQRVSRESMSPRPQNTAFSDDKPSKIPVKTKYDRHNSLQIPGPLPIGARDSEASRISHANDKNGTLKAQKGRRKNRGISLEGICGNGPTDPIKNENLDAKRNERFTSVVNGKTVGSGRVIDERQTVWNDKVGEDHNEETGKKLSFEPDVIEEDYDKATCSRNLTKLNGGTTITGQQIAASHEQPIELCEHSALVCTCPEGHTAAPVLLPCCGVQTFTPLPQTFAFRRCDCFTAGFGCGPNTAGPRLGTKPGAGMPLTPSPGNTYNVPQPEGHKSRASTPENTDNEISVMTDLPTERDGATPRDVLSPGEHKATTTYSDSYTPGHEQLLSEGEVPDGIAYPKRKVSMSMGEYPRDKRPDDIDPYNQESSAQRMEAALQAISQELARCRSLLHSQRPREQRPPSRDMASAADLTSRESIALHKAEGKSRLSNGHTPKCNFTLHVGTIVLSDEAVISSRDKPLMLSWKFYDQNVTMTRITTGRVIHFDFSTEYEVKITEEFLEYMKREEMPITICEIDKEKPFATCALPLREALLNANRRADLSLALVAVPPTPSDALNAADELGVLDLWCMLRSERRNLGLGATAMNRKISMQNSGNISNNMLNPRHEKLAQIMDDDLSNNYQMSQDLDIHLNRQNLNANKISTDTPDREKDFYVPESMSANPLGVHTSARHRNKFSGLSISSDLGMPSFDTRHSPVPTMLPPMPSDRGQVGVDALKQTDGKPSGIIFSEVNPKMRELKDVWETNNNMSLPSFDGFEKKDRNRRNTTLSAVTNIIDTATVDENHVNGHWRNKNTRNSSKEYDAPKDNMSTFTDYLTSQRKFQDMRVQSDVALGKKVTIDPNSKGRLSNNKVTSTTTDDQTRDQILSITVLWLALNEECDAMLNPNIRRLYVAYSFLGRDGAELETPVSLPKPKHYVDKCYYNFKKSFRLTEFDMPILDHMARCRSQSRTVHNSKDCIVFSVVSEPPEDPLGLDSCEDVGHAFLYLGDLLAYSSGDTFTEVLPVRAAHPGGGVCGVLAVQLDGLAVLRQRPRQQDQ